MHPEEQMKTNQTSVTVEEVAMIMGQKDIEIFALQKQIVAQARRIEELTPKSIEATSTQ